jgi:hypothetical protein
MQGSRRNFTANTAIRAGLTRNAEMMVIVLLEGRMLVMEARGLDFEYQDDQINAVDSPTSGTGGKIQGASTKEKLNDCESKSKGRHDPVLEGW